MTADIPPLLADLGAGAGDIAAVIALLALIAGIISRGFHRGSNLLRDVIREETLTPAATRDLVREEVDRAVEPHAAQFRSELRAIREQMQPNGGSSMLDRLIARMDSLEKSQRKIFAHLGTSTSGSLADANDPDPDDDTAQT